MHNGANIVFFRVIIVFFALIVCGTFKILLISWCLKGEKSDWFTNWTGYCGSRKYKKIHRSNTMKPKGSGKKSCMICRNLAYDMKKGYYCAKYKEFLQQNNHRSAIKCEKCLEERGCSIAQFWLLAFIMTFTICVCWIHRKNICPINRTSLSKMR